MDRESDVLRDALRHLPLGQTLKDLATAGWAGARRVVGYADDVRVWLRDRMWV